MNSYTITLPVGRKRTKDFDLPPHLHRRGKALYYVGADRKWIPLGSDLGRAKRRWADLEYVVEARTVADRPPMKCEPTDGIAPHADVTKNAARQAILSTLKDPYSAVFGKVLYARLACTDGQFHTVCGLVNAKNSYGGYTGSDLWLYRVDDQGRGGLVTAITDVNDAPRSLERLDLISAVTGACVKAGK